MTWVDIAFMLFGVAVIIVLVWIWFSFADN